ncbi:MAG: hypothetical protein LBO80_05055 [Treponema sp.]|jgi:hypothetical protein|nr:hypothetical protein [Treponema sp.]
MKFSSFRTFFASLKEKPPDKRSTGRFLRDLFEMDPPPDFMPVLRDAAALAAGAYRIRTGAAGAVAARLNRRYLRLRFVQEELGKLDFKKAKNGTAFDDFIFEQTDFSTYNKIDEDIFRQFYIDGFDDFSSAFFEKAFGISREAALAAVRKGYQRTGTLYLQRKSGTPDGSGGLPRFLLLSIMRTLQTSLDFLPLIAAEEILAECNALIRFLQKETRPLQETLIDAESFFYLARNFNIFFGCLLCSLDKAVFTHDDGMETLLTAGPGQGKAAGNLALYGVFHPGGKACTIPLVSTKLRFDTVQTSFFQ